MPKIPFHLVEPGISLLIFLAFMLFRNVFVKYIFRTLLGLSSKTKSSLDEHLIISFEKPLRTFFIFLGLYAAVLYLPLSPKYDLLAGKAFRSSLIILASMGLFNFLGKYEALQEDLEKMFNLQIDQILIPFFSKIAKVIVIALAITVVAQEWGFPVTSFIAGLGLGGLAFALAAKDTASNIFGGIVIITDKPFSIGDWISTPSIEGVVEDINFRSTKIRTFAQALVTMPNATLANEPITNWTKMGKRRITFNLGLTYNTPRIKVEKCVHEIKKMLENHPEIHKETIFVSFDSFGPSSLDLFLYFFTNTTNWGKFLKVKEDVNLKIMEILEAENVSVAFPSTSIYLETPLETYNRTCNQQY